MIKASVLYPYRPGARFDMNYYCDAHIPLCERTLRPALKGIAVDKGIAGDTPGSMPTYLAVGHLLFETVAAYEAAFESDGHAILADASNYADVIPVVQINEVMID